MPDGLAARPRRRRRPRPSRSRSSTRTSDAAAPDGRLRRGGQQRRPQGRSRARDAPAGTVYGVDHGVTFHVEHKLRTVLWGWAGRAATGGRARGAGGARDELGAADRWRASLARLLDRPRRSRPRRRCDRLLRPAPPLPIGDWPSIPWPRLLSLRDRRLGFPPCVPWPAVDCPALPRAGSARPVSTTPPRGGVVPTAPQGPARGCTSAASRRTTPPTSATPPRTSPSTWCNRVWRDAGHDGPLRAERHRHRRPAAGAGRARRRGLGRRSPMRETALFREDMTALRVLPPRRLRRRGRVDPADRRRRSSSCWTAARPTASTTAPATSTSTSPPTPTLRLRVRLRPATTMLDAVRRARRRPGPARQAGPARPAAVAGRARRVSRPGTAPLRPRAARAGTSSAPRSRWSTSATPSTSRAAAAT